MLTFIGLGLYDERSVTVEGREALRDADRAFAEFYTSRLVGTTVEELEAYHGVDIEVRNRAGVERDPEPVLDAAETAEVAFLTAGDTMISTTHVDLRLRAHERGIETRVIHGVSAQSAAAGLTGLQNYRFGKATTLPFPGAHGGDDVPASVVETIEENRARDLHTLVYLDIKVDDPTADAAGLSEGEEYMTGDYAAELLAAGWADELAVVVARAGSPDPVVAADRLSNLAEGEFGGPLHLLVVPAEPHHLEADALEALAGAPASLLGRE
ncbi:MAG: diphthine synthase [Halolamina sp.]